MVNHDLDINLTFEEIEKTFNKKSSVKIKSIKEKRKTVTVNSNIIIRSEKTLVSFFKINGFKVVDLRENGGCLWVIGDKKILEPYVKEVFKIFKVTGYYGSGRATSHKSAWWTKSQK